MKEDGKEDNTSDPILKKIWLLPRGLLPLGTLVAHPMKVEIIDFALE
jgi:hypothetical protein